MHNKKLIPVTARNEYVVIRYIEPLLGNERSLGFDIASDPVGAKHSSGPEIREKPAH